MVQLAAPGGANHTAVVATGVSGLAAGALVCIAVNVVPHAVKGVDVSCVLPVANHFDKEAKVLHLAPLTGAAVGWLVNNEAEPVHSINALSKCLTTLKLGEGGRIHYKEHPLDGLACALSEGQLK